ncbi:MAG: hypothetical protein LPK19_17680, partial [Hymenobacteraceae bacterium]|nr:hypothetical protein [Hymenobacteraceae bacterium]MDX5398087.1 hypothetical protein [Hymenobacteraceae bacterium]MDX5514159.1 hypothetical protein [Hymenobacteraceae bacterium]
MDVISQLATTLNRRDEKPNQELAIKIAEANDSAAVAELVALLQHKNKNIQADSIKALYEVGYIAPTLIAPHIQVFLDLLKSKNNRMVWGAMCALDMIALVKPTELYDALPLIMDTAEKGTVITNDRTVKLLVKLAKHPQYQEAALMLLLEQVQRAPVNQLPTYAEATASVMLPEIKEQFINIVQQKLQEVEYEAKRKRLEKIL